MANPLKREIARGEIVIINKKFIDPAYHHDLRFMALDGFGMSNLTRGTALYGVWLSDYETCRMDAFDIDARATERFQAREKALRDQSPDYYWWLDDNLYPLDTQTYAPVRAESPELLAARTRIQILHRAVEFLPLKDVPAVLRELLAANDHYLTLYLKEQHEKGDSNV